MKTIIAEHYGKELRAPFTDAWSFLPDSAVTNTGKPFYIPILDRECCACFAPALKITRLGKSIAPQFVTRYFNSVAPAVHFRMPGFMSELMEQGKAPDMATSFDKSLFIPDFFELKNIKPDSFFRYYINEEEIFRFAAVEASEAAIAVMPEISRLNTFKTGDILIPFLSNPAVVSQGDTIKVFLDDISVFNIRIK